MEVMVGAIMGDNNMAGYGIWRLKKSYSNK